MEHSATQPPLRISTRRTNLTVVQAKGIGTVSRKLRPTGRSLLELFTPSATETNQRHR
ncbi:uncharacterized protein BDW43DRAFT_279241 [Aspergillus alliaceus]|uniref:uncharacterized protein n=1 Tax=Petromyces alliaceus TaxID=209559 RepID=UPI0012A5D36B|nr:uncharacterized protein BDW43DRAFT_279241 [Aspergillus alliaceus]KAB8232366.1 hypothetical protein BDW43DRAFT_279241 [Aspergillus alliaceus]